MDRPPPYYPFGSRPSSKAGPPSEEGRRGSASKFNEASASEPPPSYSESSWRHRDEVEAIQRSRVETVCSCAQEIQHRRSRLGILHTTMALVLPDQIATGSKWTMVGWPEEEMPHFSLLPDHAGGLEFWSQRDMQSDVQRRLCDNRRGSEFAEVRLDEVFFRTENQFGLYETFEVKALIIKMAGLF